MAVLELETIEQAFECFNLASRGLEDFAGLTGISFGGWVDAKVKLELGFHSEITPPFMEAFVEAQNAIYRFVALLKYDAADIRHLSQEDFDLYQIRVKVEDGSSDITGEFGEALGKAVAAAMGKLSPAQIVVVILGLGLIMNTGPALTHFIDSRVDVRKEQIQSQERRDTLDALKSANDHLAQQTQSVVQILSERGAIGAKAVDTAATVHGALLKAASETPESIIGGHHLTRGDARELRASGRRPVARMIVEREMRVVDINTSDPAHTVIVVEDSDGQAQHRLNFADRLVEVRDMQRLFESLRARSTVWLRLDVKIVGGELRVIDILGVVPPPPPQTDGRIAEGD